MTLQNRIQSLFDDVNIEYGINEIHFIVKTPEDVQSVTIEIMRYFNDCPDECYNTGVYAVFDDEYEIYKVIVRDI